MKKETEEKREEREVMMMMLIMMMVMNDVDEMVRTAQEMADQSRCKQAS